MSARAILIDVHTAAAVLALVVGLAVLRWPRLVGPHAVLTVTMTGCLAGALWLDRADLEAGTAATFLGLLVLAGYMSARSLAAWRLARRGGPSGPVLAGVRFVCVGLVAGFVAIAVDGLSGNPLLTVSATLVAVILARAVLVRRLNVADCSTPESLLHENVKQ